MHTMSTHDEPLPPKPKSFTCTRCCYETKVMGSIRNHLFNLKKPCKYNPNGGHDIILANDQKRHILVHGSYTPPPPRPDLEIDLSSFSSSSSSSSESDDDDDGLDFDFNFNFGSNTNYQYDDDEPDCEDEDAVTVNRTINNFYTVNFIDADTGRLISSETRKAEPIYRQKKISRAKYLAVVASIAAGEVAII